MRDMLCLLGAARLSFATGGASALAQMSPMHDWGYGWGWPWGGVIGLVFFALMAIGFATVVRRLVGGKGSNGSGSSTALNVLAERYARGEIDREEYEQRRRDLAG